MAGLRWQRVAYLPLMTLTSCLLSAAAVVSGAWAASVSLSAVDPITGRNLPHASVRIGAVRREVLAPSGRVALGLRPAQVGAGGRVFAFGSVPPELGLKEFDAEILVWHGTKRGDDGESDLPPRWQRHALVHKQSGALGHVSATLVIDSLEAGPVPVAMFRREAAAGQIEWLRTHAQRIARGSQLRFAYSLDEWDWHGLAPVTLSVVAEEVRDDVPTGSEVELFREHLIPAENEPTWFDKSIDLSELAGLTVRFEFRALAHTAAGKLASGHAVWSVPQLIHGSRTAEVPSVVVVAMDGVRARSLSCCGAEREVSPFIEEFFSTQGAIFDRAVTQAVDTVPAQLTLLTGLYPSVHGVLEPEKTLSKQVVTLAQAMARRGYATAAFTDSAALAAETGAGRGFGFYRQAPVSDVWDVGGRAAATFAAALEWVGEQTATPFFVFIHTAQARPPYVPPREYVELFRESVAQPAAESDIDEGARVRYEREIRYLDDQLRFFVEQLDRLSQPDATLLIVTSAHGQEFLEHGARWSGAHLYEESVRVPLLMRGAGIRPGSRHGEVIGLVDLAPTILDFASAEIPEGIQGRSIAKALRSGLPYSLPPRFSEAHAAYRLSKDGKDANWRAPAYAVSQGGKKVIMTSGADGAVFEAYDLVDDPKEEQNLVGKGEPAPTWFEELRQVLESYPVACKRVARPAAVATELGPETRLGLRAYGYIN